MRPCAAASLRRPDVLLAPDQERSIGGVLARSVEHDDPVLVAVQHRARPERQLAEGHWHVDLALAALAAAPRVRPERLDPDRQLAQRCDVADAAVEHDPGPAL